MVIFDRSQFNKCVFFDGTKFYGDAIFAYSQFKGGACFSNCQFDAPTSFLDTYFPESSIFMYNEFSADVSFVDAKFCKFATFLRSRFSGPISFERIQFSENADFSGTQFSNDVNFLNAQFFGDANFSNSLFSGDVLTFKRARFNNPKSQEDACRKAKNLLEKNGEREEAGYHFYREMEAKRKQKPWYIRYPEFFFIQLVFGYGVHPFRLMFCWFAVATIFAFIYLAKGGIISKLPTGLLPQPLSYFVECFYFSIVTAVTPGYGKYELTSWVYQVIASVEAIFGTFMWAAFIATFARKYMR